MSSRPANARVSIGHTTASSIVWPPAWAARGHGARLVQAALATVIIGCVAAFIRWGDFSPRVEPDFFFSSHDPAARDERAIASEFPQSTQLILNVRGVVRSSVYQARVKALSDALHEVPGVLRVQSLSRGPDGLEDALRSPLWQRLLLPDPQGMSSQVFIFTQHDASSQLISAIVDARDQFQRDDFDIRISGVPYVVELIRRNLQRDLRRFSLAALLIFGAMVLLIFRSWRVLAGMLLTCSAACVATLSLTQWLRIPIGVLTANLVTIVFVLTLSPSVFLTFNGRRLIREGVMQPGDGSAAAVRETIGPAFWSMTTTLLGFVSLLLVPAEPLRQLGVAGSIGAVVAATMAFGVYPWFLSPWPAAVWATPAKRARRNDPGPAWWAKPRALIAAAVIIVAVGLGTGIPRLVTDPSLLAYFKPGSELRIGLEDVDRAGGSSPLSLVLRDLDDQPLNSEAAIERLWALHLRLEDDPAVGQVVSLPLIMMEARRKPLASLLPFEWLIKILEQPFADKLAKYFVSEDRRQVFFLLRMKEQGRTEPRLAVVDRLERLTRGYGFEPAMVGGVYVLQGKLATLVVSSLVSGIAMLLGLFAVMAWGLGRSIRIAAAMVVSLSLIPLAMLGLAGWLGVPLDVIAAPASNLALGIGVDAMLYLVIRVRRLRTGKIGPWDAWAQARREFAVPIACSALILCTGFGIFGLSSFPPTQRFGLSVVVGSFVSALVAIFVLPVLAGWTPTRFKQSAA